MSVSGEGVGSSVLLSGVAVKVKTQSSSSGLGQSAHDHADRA